MPGNPSSIRLRRRRVSKAMRRLNRETTLTAANLIYPLFVARTGQGPVDSMPGVHRLGIAAAVEVVAEAAELGVSGVLLFGIPQEKAGDGRTACQVEGVVPATVAAIKRANIDIAVITDVCLCAYTNHGQCGVLTEDGQDVDNDASLAWLASMARIHADAGADVVAPSAMMDHQVSAIRQELDLSDHQSVSIMSYSVKYKSAFYGPFRDAGGGAPQFGDRSTHQMDYCNVREALREAELDIAEGADFLMVKPALAYLDVIWRIRQAFPEVPLAAYNVSGEYAILKAAAKTDLINEREAVSEVLHSIRRAGADLIITYDALEAARWLKA